MAKYEYEAYVTDFSAEEAENWQVIELYRARGDCENVFDELKNQWGFNGFTSRFREVGEMAARLLLWFTTSGICSCACSNRTVMWKRGTGAAGFCASRRAW